MSIKSKVLAAAATLTLVGGVGAAGVLSAAPAMAGTPSCGGGCVNFFSQDFGPGFTLDVLRQGEKVGQPIILFRTANFDPALDWDITFQGTVADFFEAGLVNAETALHYGCLTAIFPGGSCSDATVPGPFPNLDAFEVEYAPYGVNSGLCLGVAATAFQNEGATLQPCGVSAKTVWIADTLDSPLTFFKGFFPAINGSNTNFSHPYVLTYPSSGYPTDKPRPQLILQNLTGFTQPAQPELPEISTVSSSQLWSAFFGVSP